MHRGKLLVLVLAVAALAAVWAVRRGAPGLEATTRRLFEGVDPARVVALRIDNLERALQLKIERDAAGTWFLTDPVPYPADDGVVRILLSVVRTSQGVERPEVDPAAVGFDPPRAILEVVERVDGGERRTSVQLGAVDVSSNRCWARQGEDGVPLLTLRTLDTALDRTPDQYRERRIALVHPSEVVAVERSGAYRFEPEGPVQELGLVAGLGPDGGWRAARPEPARLDPTAFGLLVQGLCTMRVEHFHDDSLDDLASYGLDEPLLRLDVTGAGGGRMALVFAIHPAYRDEPIRAEDNVWLAMREGFPFVWEVYGKDVRLLSAPFESLLDYRLIGGRRDLYDRLRLEAAGRALLLAREGDRWSLAVAPGGSVRDPADGEPAWSEPLPAAAGRVEDLLLALESGELYAWLPGRGFAEADVAGRFEVASRGPSPWRGELGPPHETEAGLRGRLFRRAPGEAVFLADEALLALLAPDPAQLQSLLVHRLEENLLRSLEVAGPDGARRRWTRAADGRWFRAEEPGTEARELWELLDGLVALRAERWVEPEGDPPASLPLERPLEVALTGADGTTTAFTVGLAPGGTELVRAAGRTAEVAGLHARLAALLDG